MKPPLNQAAATPHPGSGYVPFLSPRYRTGCFSGVTADIHDVPQESDPRGPAGEQTALTASLYYLIDIGFCLQKKMEEEMQGGSENNGL